MKIHFAQGGRLLGALVCGLGLFAAQPVLAQPQHVTINTDALNDGNSYFAEFTLTDGSGTGDGNSQAFISNFTVNGGTLGAVVPPTIGDATGDLGSSLTLADTSPTADFLQGFTITSPGSSISFDLNLTNSSVDPVTPDEFVLQLLDPDFNAISTNGPTGTEFVDGSFTTLGPGSTGFTSTDPNFQPALTANVTDITGVPEPSELVTLALGSLSLIGLMVRSRRKSIKA